MYVIQLDQGIQDVGTLYTEDDDFLKPSPEEHQLLSWTWLCPPSDHTVWLIQKRYPRQTQLYYNTHRVWTYEGQHTPEVVWQHMTECLLEYGIICMPLQPLSNELTLPDLTFRSNITSVQN